MASFAELWESTDVAPSKTKKEPKTGTFSELWEMEEAGTLPTPPVESSAVSAIRRNVFGLPQQQMAAQVLDIAQSQTGQQVLDQLRKFGRTTAGLADTIIGSIQALPGTAAAEIGYAGARAAEGMGLVAPGTAERGRAAVYKQFVEPYQKPVGQALGITQTPEYQAEISQKFSQFVGENFNKGADWISQQTGIPKADVENMMATIVTAAGPKAATTAKKAVTTAAGKLEQAAPEVVSKVEPFIGKQPQAKPKVTYAEFQQQFAARKATNLPENVPPETALAIKQAIGDEPLSPVVARQVSEKAAKGEVINPTAVANHNLTQSLDVPFELTPGQKTGDPVLISRERNERGIKEHYAQQFNEQNKALLANAEAIKKGVAPEVKTASYVDDSANIIDSVLEIKNANEKQIKQNYQLLEQAGGGKLPIDSQAFASDAVRRLTDTDAMDFLPSTIKSKLDAYQSGAKDMNFNQFDNLRTMIARETRKAQRADDGNAVYALGLVREALEELPMTGATAEVKSLADTARASFKAERDLEKSNMLYSKVANDAVDSKDFISKFVFQSKNKDFGPSMSLLASNPKAIESMRAGTMDYMIREATDASGNFKSAKFLDMVDSLEVNGKLDPLFGPEGAKKLRNLARAGQLTSAQPAGHFISTANTAPAIAGMVKELGPTAIENVTGIPLEKMQRFGRWWAEQKEIKRASEPGAGISTPKNKLSDLINKKD